MEGFKIGDRVHPKRYYPDNGVGTITAIHTERSLSRGVTYLQYEVEYDEPIPGVWPYLAMKRYRGYFCSDALERI